MMAMRRGSKCMPSTPGFSPKVRLVRKLEEIQYFFDWELEIAREGVSKEKPENNTFGVYLYCRSTSETDSKIRNLRCRVEFAFIDTRGRKCLQRITKQFDFAQGDGRNGWGCPEFLSFKDAKSENKPFILHDDGSAMVQTIIHIETNCFRRDLVAEEERYFLSAGNGKPEDTQSSTPSELSWCIEVCEKVLNGDDEYSDVTLRSYDHVNFYCHRVILSQCSNLLQPDPTYDKIVEGPNQQYALIDKTLGNNKLIFLHEIHSTVLTEVLRYLYTQKVDDLASIADKLLYAASKFQIADLQKLCEREICRDMSVNTAPKLLLLASVTNARFVEAKAVELIASNPVKASKTQDWVELLEFPDLVTKIFSTQIPEKATFVGREYK